MSGLLYDVPPYTAHQWRFHKIVDPAAQASESAGARQYAAFPRFAAEVFSRLHDVEPVRLDEPAPGSEPFQVLHNAIDVLPEVESLREQSLGDEYMAGVATAAILDTVLTEMAAPDALVEDPADDAEVQEYLERLREQQTKPEDQDAVDELIEEARADHAHKIGAAQDAAAKMDETDVRNALRLAAGKAREAMAEAQAAVDGFGAGLGAHSGKQQRNAASRKLSTLLKQNPQLKRIAELAGRLRRLAQDRQAKKPNNAPDEVSGIELGADLARLLPAEMMFMDEPFDPLFVSRMSDHALAQLELRQQPPKEQGPIVFLLDSSGSMRGDPIAWAAATALAYLDIAVRQRRAFALVHFGDDVLRVDQFPAGCAPSIDAMVEAVSFFAAAGGTNFEKPMRRALHEIDTNGALDGADVVMVTDGQSRVGETFLQMWNDRRQEHGLRCFSILVGNSCDRRCNAAFSDRVVELADAIKDDRGAVDLFGEI